MTLRVWSLCLRTAVAALMVSTCLAASPGNSERAANEPIHPVPAAEKLDPTRVALGARLFRDPRLSGDGRLSCLSCHAIDSNGADHRTLTWVEGRLPPLFNTPTVFDAALSFRLNWRGDVRTLEEQVQLSLENPRSMRADLPTVVQRLRADAGIVRDFESAYRRAPDRAALIDAIVQYERSLITRGSRFDRWLQGDDAALTPQELRGYRSFKSVGCVACHQGRGVGGNVFQRSGVFSPAAREPVARLRVPSLRNVATTAPYFHDGSAPTLTYAINAMARAQLGIRLSQQETADIAAFLRTLNGHHDASPVHARP